MNKLDFFSEPNFSRIIKNVRNIYNSDGSTNVLLEFESVLEAFGYQAFRNWRLGEIVDGPNITDYDVSCVLMWDYDLMPDPSFIRRLARARCSVKVKSCWIKVPMQVRDYDDYEPGTHYPRLTKKRIWLFQITVPKERMSDIKKGSVELAGEKVQLDDLEDMYARDLDQKQNRDKKDPAQPGMMPPGGPGLGPPGMPPGLGPPMPGAPML
jgi:hypothetical protein